LVDVAQLAHAM